MIQDTKYANASLIPGLQNDVSAKMKSVHHGEVAKTKDLVAVIAGRHELQTARFTNGHLGFRRTVPVRYRGSIRRGIAFGSERTTTPESSGSRPIGTSASLSVPDPAPTAKASMRAFPTGTIGNSASASL
jgi:hypothetical protein